MIDIQNLSCSYNSKIVFQNINLKIENGDYIAIVGENGSGKSSLIKMILGITKSKVNTIKINNIEVNNFKKWDKFGYVPQKMNVPHDIPITVKEYLNLYTKNKKKLNDQIQKFKLNSILDQKLNKLSGGEIQRVNIVKALLNEIEYLILDEPNTGLDINKRKELYQELHELSLSGLTIVIISHTIEEIRDKIHKIYNIETQKLIEVNKNDCYYC